VHAWVSVLVLDALHTPLPHVEAVTVRVCVPVVSQKSLKPPQLPHAPPLVPQLVPLAAYPSPGQLLLLPVQYSATSHVPPEARHWVVDGLKLQLLVDTLGLHSWQTPLGLMVPAS
jgi:hypothetical protein